MKPRTLLTLPVRVLGVVLAVPTLWQSYLVGFDSLAGPSWFLVGTILLLTSIARLNRTALLGAAYVVAFVAFIDLRMAADDTSLPVHYAYPDVMLGSLPSALLQDLFYVPGRIGAVDVLLGSVYVSHFVAMHGVALLTLKTRSRLFPSIVGTMTLILAVSLVLHVLLPTAPPWLASQEYRDEGVHRITADLSARIEGSTYEEAATRIDKNLVAAMPSVHVAFATLVALVVAQYGRTWGRVGALYVLAMCVALVYLGEHYVIDEVAGIAIAAAAWRLTVGGHWRLAVTPSWSWRKRVLETMPAASAGASAQGQELYDTAS
jgi:hypothetical protein